jgi:hypothetical protein
MRGSDYLLQENKIDAMEPSFTSRNQCWEHIALKRPGLEVLHVIAPLVVLEAVVVINTEFSRTSV